MRKEIQSQGERLGSMEELLRDLHNKILGGATCSVGVPKEFNSSIGGTSGLVNLQPHQPPKEVSIFSFSQGLVFSVEQRMKKG